MARSADAAPLVVRLGRPRGVRLDRGQELMGDVCVQKRAVVGCSLNRMLHSSDTHAYRRKKVTVTAGRKAVPAETVLKIAGTPPTPPIA
jgi:hypothetical protein